MPHSRVHFLLLSSTGFVLIIFGLLQLTVLPLVIEDMIKNSLPIINSSESKTVDKWLRPPIPIITEFYFFNITNPDQVTESGEKPLLREVGPYVFREERHKVQVEWSEDENTVAYDQIRGWYFMPDASGDNSLEDVVYHLNVPLVASADYVRRSRMDQKEKLFLYYSINQMHNLTSSYLFSSHTIRQLMFDGYTDALIQESYLLNFDGVTIPFDRFGWFHGKNNTSSDGRFEIFTGKSNLNTMGQLYSWNGSVELKHFYGKCKSLTRTGVDFQPAFQDPTPASIRIFVADICRPLTLFFERQVKRNGVTSNRYVADGRTFDYSMDENRCYCRGSCPRSGVADTSSCTFDTPSAFSLPHFHFADPFFSEQVRGLNPSPGRHAFYFDVHPALGIPVDVHVAAQINIIVRKDDRVERLRNLKQQETYFPTIWFVAKASATDQMMSELRLLQIIPFYVTLSGIVTIVSGFVVILFAIHWNWEYVSLLVINYRNRKRLQMRQKRHQTKDRTEIPLNPHS